jgi:hypothetical protein
MPPSERRIDFSSPDLQCARHRRSSVKASSRPARTQNATSEESHHHDFESLKTPLAMNLPEHSMHEREMPAQLSKSMPDKKSSNQGKEKAPIADHKSRNTKKSARRALGHRKTIEPIRSHLRANPLRGPRSPRSAPEAIRDVFALQVTIAFAAHPEKTQAIPPIPSYGAPAPSES